MTEVKETGGARIGMVNITWPFATLTVTKNILQLNATIAGNLIFKSDDIVSIEPYSVLFSSGLKINHKVPKYKKHVVFWAFSSPTELIRKIEQTGFLTNTNPIDATLEQQIATTQSKGGFPIKTNAAIAIVGIWTILYLIDFQNYFRRDNEGALLGVGSQFALGFVLLTCLLLLTFMPARRLILKKGHSIDNIKKFIYFVMIICGLVLLNITLRN